MNNKGFAITTILYGALILFCMLLLSMLGILASYKCNLEKLIDSHNGSRDIAKLPVKNVNDISEIKERGLYCIGNNCKYVSSNDIINGINGF